MDLGNIILRMAEPIYETSTFLPLKELDDSNVWIETSESEKQRRIICSKVLT